MLCVVNFVSWLCYDCLFEQTPMPPVAALIEALLQRANNDIVTPNIPLSETYHSGSMSSHV